MFELSTKWKIYNIFHMPLLEQDTTKKEWVNKKTLLKPEEFQTRDSKKYKVKVIIDSTVYKKEANNQIFGLYYLVLWKGYLEKKSS